MKAERAADLFHRKERIGPHGPAEAAHLEAKRFLVETVLDHSHVHGLAFFPVLALEGLDVDALALRRRGGRGRRLFGRDRRGLQDQQNEQECTRTEHQSASFAAACCWAAWATSFASCSAS